jgi:hypothetical protein
MRINIGGIFRAGLRLAAGNRSRVANGLALPANDWRIRLKNEKIRERNLIINSEGGWLISCKPQKQ